MSDGAQGAGTVTGQPQTLDLAKHGAFLVPVKGFDKPVPLAEVARGFMRNSDYTNKTMALAEKQKGLDSRMERYEMMDKWFVALDQNPEETFRHMQRAFNVTPDPGSVTGDIDDLDPQVASLQNELSALKSQLEQSTQTSQAMVDEQQLRDQFPDLALDDVKAYMGANNMAPTRSVLEAAKLMSYDRLAEEQAMHRQTEQQRQADLDAVVAAKQGLPPVTPGGAPTPSPDLLPNVEPELPSWDQAVELGLSDIGQAGF